MTPSWPATRLATPNVGRSRITGCAAAFWNDSCTTAPHCASPRSPCSSGCSATGYRQPNPTCGSPSTDCRTSCMPCSRSCATSPARSTRRCSTRPDSARPCARPPMASPRSCGSTPRRSGSGLPSRAPPTSPSPRVSTPSTAARPPVEVLVRRDVDVLAVHVAGVDVRHARLMQDKVRRLGGTIDVAGGPGIGTIIARIPCE